MIRTLKLTNVTKYTKDKNGNDYKDKNGKPFIRVSMTAEGLEKAASALVYRNTDPIYNWKVGDTVQAIVTYNGDYINIRAAGRLDMLEARIEKLEAKPAIGELTSANEPSLGDEEVEAEPADAVNPENLPF